MSNVNYDDKIQKYKLKYFNVVKQLEGRPLWFIGFEKDLKDIISSFNTDSMILIGSGGIALYLRDIYLETNNDELLVELDNLKVNDLDFINYNNTVLPKKIGDFTSVNTNNKNNSYTREVLANNNTNNHVINEFDISNVNNSFKDKFVIIDGVKVLNLMTLENFYKKTNPCKILNDEKIRVLNLIINIVSQNAKLSQKYNLEQ